MKKYKLLIYGKTSESIGRIRLSFQMLTYGLYEEMKRLPNIELILRDVDQDKNLKELPPADFIIVINYSTFFKDSKNMVILRKKYKKVISFMETSTLADWSFIFKPVEHPLHNPAKATIIPAPYLPEFVENVEKEPKTILLDHIWLNWMRLGRNNFEWSRKIYQWLEELKDEYKISCLIRQCTNKDGTKWEDIGREMLPDYIKPLETTHILQYFVATEKFENFIVTHSGSYNYSVVDMAIRGIRVFTRPGFIPSYNLKLFKIPYFRDEKELIRKIKKPIDKVFWNNQITKATPMNKIAKIVDNQLQKWT